MCIYKEFLTIVCSEIYAALHNIYNLISNLIYMSVKWSLCLIYPNSSDYHKFKSKEIRSWPTKRVGDYVHL